MGAETEAALTLAPSPASVRVTCDCLLPYGPYGTTRRRRRAMLSCDHRALHVAALVARCAGACACVRARCAKSKTYMYMYMKIQNCRSRRRHTPRAARAGRILSDRAFRVAHPDHVKQKALFDALTRSEWPLSLKAHALI